MFDRHHVHRHLTGVQSQRPQTTRRRQRLRRSCTKGVETAAQHADGGWGAGSHAAQRIRDPHAVKTDPSTTAFAGLALLRAGAHPEAVARATDYVVRAVEAAPEAGPLITDITGTQPQRKLGPYIDTVLTVQFLSRVVENLPAGSDRMKRVRGALEGCVRKLQAAQTGDGSWGADRGWAPVLQSSLATSALEMASVAETDVNPESLNRARDYQKGRFDVASGRASGEGVAGVELYSLASAKRANAARARYAMSAIEEAKAKGDLPDDAAVSEENLDAAGVPADVVGGLAESFREADLQGDRLANDDALLRGFGSNGGEEYLSYLQMSEALVIEGRDEWLNGKRRCTASSRRSRARMAAGPDTLHNEPGSSARWRLYRPSLRISTKSFFARRLRF